MSHYFLDRRYTVDQNTFSIRKLIDICFWTNKFKIYDYFRCKQTP